MQNNPLKLFVAGKFCEMGRKLDAENVDCVTAGWDWFSPENKVDIVLPGVTSMGLAEGSGTPRCWIDMEEELDINEARDKGDESGSEDTIGLGIGTFGCSFNFSLSVKSIPEWLWRDGIVRFIPEMRWFDNCFTAFTKLVLILYAYTPILRCEKKIRIPVYSKL